MKERKSGGCTRFVKIFLLLLVIMIVAVGGAFAYYNFFISSSAQNLNVEVSYELKPGTNAMQVSEDLEQLKAVDNRYLFFIYLKLNQLENKLKAGEFDIPAGVTPIDLAKLITTVPQLNQQTILIREGERYSETKVSLQKQLDGSDVKIDWAIMDSIFAAPENFYDKLDTDVVAFLTKYKPAGKTLEGFLYPDTYKVDKKFDSYKLTNLLVGTLIDKLDASDINEIDNGNHKLYDVLKIASILEWEANNPADYKLVAGVIYNRLSRGMLLGMDTTVLYGLNRRVPEPTAKELQDSTNLYNTRLLPGLMPTPINNPNITTIEAAIFPTKNDYLYFIAGKDGKMYYAKTLAEHNSNIKKYL